MSQWKTATVKSDNEKFFKAAEGNNRVRVLSEPFGIWVSFSKGPDGKKQAKKYLDESLSHEDPAAKQRFCFWVIDRADGKVKLAEVGASIINQISFLAQDPDYKFDTIPGYDLKINREGSGMETKYSVLAAPPTPLTPAEGMIMGGLEDIGEFLKKQPGIVLTSQQKIEEIPF